MKESEWERGGLVFWGRKETESVCCQNTVYRGIESRNSAGGFMPLGARRRGYLLKCTVDVRVTAWASLTGVKGQCQRSRELVRGGCEQFSTDQVWTLFKADISSEQEKERQLEIVTWMTALFCWSDPGSRVSVTVNNTNNSRALEQNPTTVKVTDSSLAFPALTSQTATERCKAPRTQTLFLSRREQLSSAKYPKRCPFFFLLLLWLDSCSFQSKLKWTKRVNRQTFSQNWIQVLRSMERFNTYRSTTTKQTGWRLFGTNQKPWVETL